jgi:hypothetical protein
MDAHRSFIAILSSPYPSDADKEHAKVLMRKINRLKMSRDRIRSLLDQRQNAALAESNHQGPRNDHP